MKININPPKKSNQLCCNVWRIHVSGWFLGLSKACCLQDWKALWSDDTYVYLHRHKHGYGTLQIIQFYCGRGRMENFIKEGKSGFDFVAVSSRSKTVNANRMRIHMFAYNLFNWVRRLVLPASMRKQQIDTIRLKLMKIAAKAVHSARYITFKLCSSCPYKKEFYKTLENIQQLNVQLE